MFWHFLCHIGYFFCKIACQMTSDKSWISKINEFLHSRTISFTLTDIIHVKPMQYCWHLSRNVNNTALENVDVMTYILHPFAMFYGAAKRAYIVQTIYKTLHKILQRNFEPSYFRLGFPFIKWLNPRTAYYDLTKDIFKNFKMSVTWISILDQNRFFSNWNVQF